ncbi:head morphogenesis [Shigella phage vB_SflS-ISF001]|uniref:Minor capsid protein n=1 Tax=Shigella phage vB_SflS-ISF001 TaxID=2048005 RepID=A0A2D1GQ23_9CAUD|nr:head morphogenesis [Shigella phage vB_SflS-ISF001]ATN94117.1 minor capsid protein [Shigella phage vB_SflS-ISF001]
MKINGVATQWRYPEMSERAMSRSLQDVADKLTETMRDELKPMKIDATDEEIDKAEMSLLDYVGSLIAPIIGSLSSDALTIYKFNSKQWLRIARNAGGKKNQAVMLLALIGPTAAENWYSGQYNLWRSQVTTSIRKFAANMVTDFTAKLRAAFGQGKSNDFVVDLAKERFGINRNWAKNRASGIVGTWNSRRMRPRIKDAEVYYYFWGGVMDLREREKHVRWEGKRIAVDSDLVFPGEEDNCPCWAVPVFYTGD